MSKLPKRPRRLATVFSSRGRPLFYVTVCTYRRRALLADPFVQGAFITFCEASPDRIRVWVGKYVMMPDHLHVFVSAEGSQSLSKWVGSLKNYLASSWRKVGVEGPYWQEGFFDHLLRSGESYAEKWEYVERNPVRAGLVRTASEWSYSGEIHSLSW